ncbi:MAG: endonuclease MutS2 [Thermomicrobiales bacterium]|nr:endonuclease MutS2 [Thermomicrobiales bacterium]
METHQPSLHEAVLRKLEFPEVIRQLAEACHFSVAAERALETGPSGEATQVEYLLSITDEAVELITNFPDLTIGGARDIREIVGRAVKGGRLQPPDLLLVLDTIQAARQLKRSFFRIPGVETRFPGLSDFAIHLAEQHNLETDIARSINARGDVLDTASAELGRIRREIRVQHSRLMDRLNSYLTSAKSGGALQDALITMRDGRYVIPVRSDARASIPGVVHDTSASGQTLFIEPLAIVELNNKWREAQLEEQHEIDRILDALSDDVALAGEALQLSVDAAAAIDLAMAKARLAFRMKATRPQLWKGVNRDRDGHLTHRIDLKKARHPLLDPETVVPTTIELGSGYRVLLITGPNTGGKTVALKTVGLLTLMAQAGLYIPADDGSIVSVFPAVFVDIGDEQSIAQNLSTFSGHMKTVVQMLRHVSSDSLVLLDELGAGTDPQEGSALARAIISSLLKTGPLVIGTTHYSEVKAFAYATPGVENASVEFDVKTLAPTYRLMIGVPGRSNALAIAKRLGMPRAILDEASGMVDPDEIRVDTLLQDIRKRKTEAEAAVEAARVERAEIERLRAEIEQERREAAAMRREARAEALAEAEVELGEIRDTLRRLQRDREMIGATRTHVEQRQQEVDRAAAIAKELKRKSAPPPPPPNQAPKRISVGDKVLIESLGEQGEVVQVIGDEADVQFGALKMRQPLSGLRRLGRARDERQEQVRVAVAPLPYVPMEIDIRGNRAAEIDGILESYLHEAYRGGLPMVRIIHGKGTGALRTVVRELLRTSPIVERQVSAPANEGGDGATLAYLRAN